LTSRTRQNAKKKGGVGYQFPNRVDAMSMDGLKDVAGQAGLLLQHGYSQDQAEEVAGLIQIGGSTGLRGCDIQGLNVGNVTLEGDGTIVLHVVEKTDHLGCGRDCYIAASKSSLYPRDFLLKKMTGGGAIRSMPFSLKARRCRSSSKPYGRSHES
jgi:hypothetical protein